MSLPGTFSLRVRGGKTVPIPSVGYGTIPDDASTLADTVASAIKLGVRHLDCAWEYGVDKEVGEGIRKSGVPRSELFITTKIIPHFYHPEHIPICLQQMLDAMQQDYVDLLLLHVPVAHKPQSNIASARCFPGASFDDRRIEVTEKNLWIIDAAHSTRDIAAANGLQGSIIPTWKAMKGLVKAGKARAVGVSNFSIVQLEEIINDPSYTEDDIPLSANQIEMHAYAPRTPLVEFMHQHQIVPMAHSPFATFKWHYNPAISDWDTEPLVPEGQPTTLLSNPTIKSIATKYGMGTGQVLQSWAVQRGTIPLGRSTKENRIKENMDVRQLDQQDIDAIRDLQCPGVKGRGLLLQDVYTGIKFPQEVV